MFKKRRELPSPKTALSTLSAYRSGSCQREAGQGQTRDASAQWTGLRRASVLWFWRRGNRFKRGVSGAAPNRPRPSALPGYGSGLRKLRQWQLRHYRVVNWRKASQRSRLQAGRAFRGATTMLYAPAGDWLPNTWSTALALIGRVVKYVQLFANQRSFSNSSARTKRVPDHIQNNCGWRATLA